MKKKSIKRVFFILLLSVIIPFVSFSQDRPLEDFYVGGKNYFPPLTLKEMVECVKEMHINKAPRNEIASWLAEVIDLRVTNMNSLERVTDSRNILSNEGEELFDEYYDKNIKDYESIAIWAWNNGMGNCQEASNIVYYILKQAGVPKDFRQITTGQHQFTVWGLAPKANIATPDTWGSKAIVVDPWLGKTTDFKGVKSGYYYLNNDPTIKLTDVTFSFDNNSKDWKSPAEKALDIADKWNLRKCDNSNPKKGNMSDQLFPKKHEGTYVKCRFHYPNKKGNELLASRIGYYENKKVFAEYYDSRNFLSKQIIFNKNGKKSEVTNFYDTGDKSSYNTYDSKGARSFYKAWHKDGREK